MTGFIDPLDRSGAEPEPETPGADAGQDLIASVRDLALRAHPEMVPELVRGDSLTALLASIEPARQAYAELMARIQPESTPPAPAVPAGGSVTAPLDLDRIPTAEKLRRGIEERTRQASR
jgi:hypothetical protein